MTTVDRLADLIGAQTRVRVGTVEGVLVGFRSGRGGTTLRILDDDGTEREAAGELVELEPVDEQALAAHRAEQARLEREKLAARAAVATDAAKAALLALNRESLAVVLASPEVAARLDRVPNVTSNPGR